MTHECGIPYVEWVKCRQGCVAYHFSCALVARFEARLKLSWLKLELGLSSIIKLARYSSLVHE